MLDKMPIHLNSASKFEYGSPVRKIREIPWTALQKIRDLTITGCRMEAYNISFGKWIGDLLEPFLGLARTLPTSLPKLEALALRLELRLPTREISQIDRHYLTGLALVIVQALSELSLYTQTRISFEIEWVGIS